MMVLDYSTVISQTSDDVEKAKRNIAFSFGHIPIISFFSFLLSSKQEKIKRTFNFQLTMSKMMLNDMTVNYASMVDSDLSAMIKLMNKQINMNIEMQANVEKHIKKSGNKNPLLDTVNADLQESISNLYACLRLLKRATKKSSHETSELAKCAAAITAHTLKTIYANNYQQEVYLT